MVYSIRNYLVATVLFVFCSAFAGSAVGQEASWTEDKKDDAGSGPREAQRTRGSGDCKKVTGSTLSAAVSGFGGGAGRSGSQDTEDLFVIWVANPEKFNVSLQNADDGFANFASSLYLFDVGIRFPDPDLTVESMFALLGNRDETGAEGAFLPREATDSTAAKVSARGYYVIAVAGASAQPFVNTKSGNLLALFDFLTSGEVSGPDGEGGQIPVTQANHSWSADSQGGIYQMGLEGISFSLPLEVPTSNFYPPTAFVSEGQYPVTINPQSQDEVRSDCIDDDGNNIEFFNSLWWYFEAKDTGSYRLSTCNETEFDSILGVYKDTGLCQGDIDGDGSCDVRDFSTLLVQWGSTGPEADLDGDGLVGIGDFQIFLVGFGGCIPVPELVACNDDAIECDNGGSEVVWDAASGERFFLRLGTFESSNFGSAILKIGPAGSGQ